MHFRFVEERSRLGFASANALAVALGASQVAVKRIEDGTSTPGGEMLASFAAIGADVGYVLTGKRSTQIDVQKLGVCEAAIRFAYEEARAGRIAGAIRARMSALVYNQLAGKLKETDDFSTQAIKAAQLLIESLDDPADLNMLERNLFSNVPSNEASQGKEQAAAISVTGVGNRVAGRDVISGQKRPAKPSSKR